MSAILLEILVIVLLVIANGILAMTEMALVSSRKARLQEMSTKGRAGAKAALALAENPTGFLSTVQIGITLVGILAGAFAGATLAEHIQAGLEPIAVIGPYAEALSVFIVVVSVTYLSLVAGELVPKRLALDHAEEIACLMAKPMMALSRATGPLVDFLTASTELALRGLGLKSGAKPPVSEEEIKVLIEQGTRAGVFEPSEQNMVGEVLELHDKIVRELMTPRKDMVWLNTRDSREDILTKMADSPHTRYLVCDGEIDNPLGFIEAKQVLLRAVSGDALDLTCSLQKPLFLPEYKSALSTIEMFKESRTHFALIVDEYGGILGMLTIMDVLEAIMGDLSAPGEEPRWQAIRREDGSWLMDGSLPMDEFKEIMSLSELPAGSDKLYRSLAGFVLNELGHIPKESEVLEWNSLRLEVVDMDGYKIDKVLVSQRPAG